MFPSRSFYYSGRRDGQRLRFWNSIFSDELLCFIGFVCDLCSWHEERFIEEAISLPWKDLPRRMSKLYFATRVIKKVEQSVGRNPGETSSSDLSIALKLRKDLCDAQSLNEAHVPTKLLERLLAVGAEEFPPVCAILGGILGQEEISLPWKDLPRRMSKLYFAMRVIEKLEQSEGRNPGETSSSDLSIALKLRKDLCDAQSLNEAHIPTKLLERLLAAGTEEFPPVCAILGGILGQEVIKAVSGKGDPLKNFFYYDVEDGKGVIEDVSPPVTSNTNGQP